MLAVSAGWLVIIALTQIEHSASALSWGLWVCTAAAWTWAAAWPRHGYPTLLAALIASTWIQSLLSVPAVLFLEVEPAVAWTILTVLCLGLYLPAPRAQMSVIAVTAASVTALALVAWRTGTWEQSWQQILTLGLFALGDGLATAAATTAIRRSAQASDEALLTLHRLQEEQAAQQARTANQTRVRRLLHDTVVNTLLVVRKGVDDASIPALRERCAADLATAERLWTSFGDPSQRSAEDIVHDVRVRAENLNLQLDIDTRVSSDALIPASVARAVIAGCGEALVNVHKHADVHEASLRLTWSGQRLTAQIQDRGRGWDGHKTPGHGLDVTLTQAGRSAGVTASVSSAPGRGTRVWMQWQPPVEPVDADPLHPDRVLARAAVAIGGWIALMVAGVTALAWSAVPSPGSLITLVLLAAVLGVGWWASRGGVGIPVRWPLGMALLAVAAVVTVLPAGNATACDQIALGYFGGDASIVVLIVLVALTRGPRWPVAGAAVLCIGVLAYPLGTALPAECQSLPGRLLILDLGILMAVLVAREVLLRFWEQARRMQQQIHAQRTAAQVSRAVQRSRDARLDEIVVCALPVLADIASGEADPHEASVRWQAQVHEEAVRAMLLAGPDPSGVTEVLLDAVVLSAHAGVSLTLTVLPQQPLGCPTDLGAAIAGLVASLTSGSRASASVMRENHEAVLVMTAPSTADTSGLTRVQDITVMLVPLGEQTLIEARWAI